MRMLDSASDFPGWVGPVEGLVARQRRAGGLVLVALLLRLLSPGQIAVRCLVRRSRAWVAGVAHPGGAI
jgi:hypothetical protein